MVVARDWGWRKWGHTDPKGTNFPVTRWVGARDLMYNMVTVVNTVLYTLKLL